ncbi:Bax inhibitor-1/YccA family protein [Algisphaera agarilytica]|uniref:Putative YccA/Bax inhibitor family protein n=1 Tax=Algisphaera agarilytica TaxID=1385975 RepID=A0A7X0H7P4_9BACT|nr:Bax inhibitor-1/YccA family protein [Algisphaera agarilytica]MBB6429340.1 putative YccA/Bax inhibitor family protein [Algisphaera agarilytica]
MFSSNPTLNDDTFRNQAVDVYDAEKPDVMTVQGAVNKTLILLAICVGTSVFSWSAASSGASYTMPMALGGAIGGFIVALITMFKPRWSPFTSPIYALLQGLFLGAISYIYEASFGAQQTSGGLPLNGIVVQAVGCTLGVAASMLILYSFRIIKVTEKLRAGIIMAVTGVMLFYLVSIVLSLFGIGQSILHGTGPLSIGISLLIVGIAAFSLLLDFDLIERGAQQGAPDYMEWYAGFGLLVTLIWLYLEMLRLLAKLKNR